MKLVRKGKEEKESDEELKEIITEIDLEKDGAVYTTEFVRTMQKAELVGYTVY